MKEMEGSRKKKTELKTESLIDKPMIRNSLICKLINVQASMKENNEKKINNEHEISKLTKAPPKDTAALDKRSVLAKVNSQDLEHRNLLQAKSLNLENIMNEKMPKRRIQITELHSQQIEKKQEIRPLRRFHIFYLILLINL